MWGLILQGMNILTKVRIFTKLSTPIGILYKKILGINPNSILLKKIRMSKHTLLSYITKGKLNVLLRRMYETDSDFARVMLRVFNKQINPVGKNTKFKILAIRPRKKVSSDMQQLLDMFWDNSSSGRISSSSDDGGSDFPSYEREENTTDRFIENAIFISSWTKQGMYNKLTNTATLQHRDKWYTYPNFPYQWFQLMARGFSPFGYGAGSVWWAEYKKNPKTKARLLPTKIYAGVN